MDHNLTWVKFIVSNFKQRNINLKKYVTASNYDYKTKYIQFICVELFYNLIRTMYVSNCFNRTHTNK